MSREYVTQPGEDLDMICHREYGASADGVVQVLEANPEIAPFAHDLPPRTRIVLPDAAAVKSPDTTVRLWD